MDHWKRFLPIVALSVLIACGSPGLGPGPDPDPDPDPDPSPRPGVISGTLVYPGAFEGPTATSVPADFAVSHTVRGSGRDVKVVPGEVIVRFAADGVGRLDAVEVAGVTLAHARSVPGSALELYRTDGLSQDETLALVAATRTRSDVEEAFPNWVVHTFATPNDEFYAFQWHYGAANLPNAWDIEDGTSSPVTVAVVDTGIARHPDLDANVLPGYDFVDGDADPTDPGVGTDFHGSHVAGTVAAVTNNTLGVAGVSWGARIVPVRVLGSNGSGTMADLIAGVVWAAGNPENDPALPNNPYPARVVNLSVGGDIGEACPRSYDELFGKLVANGAILVAAAGNDGVDAEHAFPANCSNVIAVGAAGPDGTRVPYSNYGSVIDLMAPGGDTSRTLEIAGRTVVAGVLSTIIGPTGAPDYAFYQGTSMAAAHVAGLVALMLAADPSLTPAQVTGRLRTSARQLDAAACGRPTGSDCGAGLIDAAAALTSPSSPPAPPPEPPPLATDVPTYVVAFYCLPFAGDPCGDFDFDRTAERIVPTTSLQIAYDLTGLEPGTYLVAAWQDLDQDLVVDEGEPFGLYPDLIPIASGEVRTGVTVHMEPLTLSAAALRSGPLAGLQRLRSALGH